MNDDTETLAAAMVQADRFCLRVHGLIADRPPDSDTAELRLKLNQSHAMLSDLQGFYNDGELNIENPSVRSEFRALITSLLWVSFRARKLLDYKTFRMLVSVENAIAIMLDRSSRDFPD